MTSYVYHGPRFAMLALFFVHGFVYAAWVSRIPSIQARLGLTTTELGLVLLGFAAGAIPAMVLSGAVSARHGSRPVLAAATLAFCAALPGMALAGNGPLLFAALVLFGAAGGSMDVAKNAHASELERLAGGSFMSTFHAFFSLGAMAGAGIGALAGGAGVAPVPHLSVAAAAAGVVAMVAARRLLPASTDAQPHGTVLAKPSRALLALAAFAFAMVLSEGAMADWSAVYLGRVLLAEPAVAPLGYACFSAAMTAGRLGGDRLSLRLGRVTTVRAGTLLGAAGLVVALLASSPLQALAGFAAVGAGFSVVVPLIFSAAARRASSAGVGMATVVTAGYAGLLTGPPLIGALAAATSLRTALFLPSGLALVGFALASQTADPERVRAVPALSER
ncbi:MAG: MFS transporter [Bryobacteraceae bacterium]|nr:MFS transporter [Bryobacteraceae bacterium]